MKTNRFAAIELLESRIAPAGVVTVAYDPATGVLTLTGDTADNVVGVFQTGPGQHRIEGTSGTTLNPGGVAAMDIGKLTALTIVAGDGADQFNLVNLLTLTTLSYDGGIGSDTFRSTNLTVKGPVEISGGTGGDDVFFDGLATLVSGDMHIQDSAGGSVTFFSAGKTVIGGRLLFDGGTGPSLLAGAQAPLADTVAGSISIAKGIQFNAGSAGDQLLFENQGGTTLGKLPTGESILYTGGNGADGLTLSSATVTMTGGLRMTGGGGSDLIDFTEADCIAKLGKLPTGQSILFDAGTGPAFMNVVVSSLAATGAIEFLGGDGINALLLGLPGGSVTLGKLPGGESIKYVGGPLADTLTSQATKTIMAGAISFEGGIGVNAAALTSANGTVKVGKLPSGHSILFSGGSDADTLTSETGQLTLAGALLFEGGSGTNTVSLSSASLSSAHGTVRLGKLASGESIRFIGGDDADSFTTDAAVFTASGGVTFVGNPGTNEFRFNGFTSLVTLGKLATGQSIDYSGEAGGDSLSFGAGTLLAAGGIEMNAGKGTNALTMGGDGIRKLGIIATGQSIRFLDTSAASSSIFVAGRLVTLKGSVEMSGTGEKSLEVQGASVSIGKTAAGDSILLNGSSGDDAVALTSGNITLLGNLTLNGGNGLDSLILGTLDRLTVKGNANFDGGPGNDELFVDAFALSVGGKLTFTGGDGIDTASVAAEGSIVGDVLLDLGTATGGDQVVTLKSRNGLRSGLNLKGALSVLSAVDAASTDSLTMTNVAVAKAVDINFGAGDGFVSIDNLVADDVLGIVTGDGINNVFIERGDFAGNSIIAKLATIQFGSGTDTLLIGRATPAPNGGAADSTRVRFLGGLTADGGGGADTRNADLEIENDFPLGPPTLNSF